MEKIIAIPLVNGVLSEHFGHCQTFSIVYVVDNKIKEIKEFQPPEHTPGLYPRWIAQFGVTDVIVGGIGQKAIDLFNQHNINVFAGAPIKKAEELVNSFLENKLVLNANYCNHDGQHGH